MAKTKRNNKRKSRRNNKRKFRRSRKNRSVVARGPNSPISPTGLVSCSMCNDKFPRNEMLVPSGCPGTTMPGTKRPYADRSHRVCSGCWWPKEGKPNSGFARLDGPHGCPGCKKGLPPNPPLKQPEVAEIIELLSSSD